LDDPEVAVAVPQQLLPAESESLNPHVPYARKGRALDVNLSVHHGSLVSVPCFHDGGPLEISFAPFFCALIRRSAFDQLEGLDAQFGRHFRSDRTFCSLVRNLLGMKVVYAPDAVVHHMHQVATKQLGRTAPDAYKLLYQANAWSPEMAAQLGFKQAAWDSRRP
jgi:GT2 family glycosyltransferase